jgi:hypothetical protein
MILPMRAPNTNELEGWMADVEIPPLAPRIPDYGVEGPPGPAAIAGCPGWRRQAAGSTPPTRP